MNYTDEQKKIIRGLNDGKFSNIWEYFVSITLETDRKTKEPYAEQIPNIDWHISLTDSNSPHSESFYIRIHSNTFEKLLDFYKVCEDLGSHNLILSLSPNIYLTVDHNAGDLRIKLDKEKQKQRENIMCVIQLLTSNLPIPIINRSRSRSGADDTRLRQENYYPLPALQTFIDSDFKTSEQLKHREQVLQQKKSYYLAMGLAFFSIILSSATLMWNILKPSDSKITIKNPQDTIKVINITPINPVLKDSIKAGTNKK